MIVQDKPRDPRFYKEPPKGAQAPVKTGSPELKCSYQVCSTRVDMTYTAPENVDNFAKVHGFIDGTYREYDGHGGNGQDKYLTKKGLFCSKRCLILQQQAEDQVDKLARMAASASKQLMGTEPTSPLVEMTVDTHGNERHYVKCSRWACGPPQARFDVASGITAADALRAAIGNGFVQTSDGLFCSHQCARKCRKELEAGIQDPARKPHLEAPTEMTPTTVVPAPVAVQAASATDVDAVPRMEIETPPSATQEPVRAVPVPQAAQTKHSQHQERRR